MWVLVGLLGLAVLACVLAYLPPVQRFAIDKASGLVAEKTGMQLSVGKFRLRFPLGVSVYGATLVTPAGDTLAAAGSLKARAAVWPLVAGKVRATDISLTDARSVYRDTVSGMVIRARLSGLTVGSASLGIRERSVVVRGAAADGADVALTLGGGAQNPKSDTIAKTAAPWSIEIRRFDLSGSRFAMLNPPAAPAAASPSVPFDPRNILADSIELTVRDVEYRPGDISATLQKLALTGRSGLRITSGSGDFSMTAGGLSLKDFTLATPASHLTATAEAGAGALQAAPDAPVSLTLSAQVAADDMALFAPLPPTLHGEKLTLETDVKGTLGDITIDRLAVSMPAHGLNINAKGNLRSPAVPSEISGAATFDGTLGDLDFARGFVADTALRHRLAFPPGMKFDGAARFSPDDYELSQFTLATGAGRLDAEGRYTASERKYSAAVRLDAFPLGDFLPRDSLDKATLSLAAHGRGFDLLAPPGSSAAMNAGARLSIDRLDYRGFTYHDMTLETSLAGGKLDGRLASSNEALSLDLALGGELAREKYTAEVKGDIWRADLRKMGFSGGTLAVTTQVDIRAEIPRGTPLSAPDTVRYTLTAAIDSTVMRIGETSARIAGTTITASASAKGSAAAIRSGDLTLDLSSPLPLDSLVLGARVVGSEVRRQLAARHFSADSLQSAFPGMTLVAKAGQGNFLREMARLRGVDFRTLSADISTVRGTPFSIDARVTGFSTGKKLTLDTIGMQAHRNGNMLDYSLRLANRPGNTEALALLEVSGSAGGNRVSVNVLQRNRSDSVGFRFGVDAGLYGNTIRAAMTPQTPVLGYRQWTVNEGNGIEYDTDGRLRADLHLTGASPQEYVNLTSASLPDIPDGALRLEMAGIGIAPLLDLLPTAPPLDGTVSSDLTFGFRDGEAPDQKKIIAAKGALGVAGFKYNDQRVADVAANVDFGSDAAGRMALDASVMLENKTALTATGYYTAQAMDFALTIPGVPLPAVQSFLPAGTTKLTGELDGNVHITGLPANPSITGDVGFTGARAEVGMIGTAFTISPDRITVDGKTLAFNDFGIVAPNGQKLAIDGTMNVSRLFSPSADVRLSAQNFRVIDSRHIGGSQAYGTAAFDADITAKGALSNMTVRGDIALSETTDVTYILRNQKKVRDERQDIVEFTVFADSLYVDDAAATPLRSRAGIDMLVGVTIADGVKATLSLDELSENRVELIGGGDLAFSMNTRGDVRLAGRYTLSGGTVYYKPPVIAQKIFAVKDGSYVEWTGGAAAPEFHVTATQTSKIALDYDDGSSEQVAFDISMGISGSLAAIDMRFDVAAPGNLAIQNQLLAMSEEQRMGQALTLLAYGQYTGDGVSAKGASFDARNTINDFISKEVNQWARNNLRGVDFSMGISRAGSEAAGNAHTDYSYSVSKSFGDRVKVSIGGSVSDNADSQNFADNLLDDVTLEYRLTRRDNMFLKLYRLGTRESILEGEVTETGGGFLMRKKMNRFGDLFRRNRDKKQKNK